MSGNPNYQKVKDGWMRKPDAPDAKHRSRINWDRLVSIANARQGISELRERQNQRNEEHQKRHGNG